ncbi:MAG: succinylglutamate desuccinylase/aspartoacylase family protein [Paludibacteraceae bacterium]|nr:succinylglutamate desuccinylase/aspartoacylase family protein [Paludibacteraceae bacterium]
MIKTIISSELPVGEQFLVKKNVLTNGKGGKRICIVTGTHGDELEGQMVCYEVCKTIRENIDLLDGTVEIYPALNPLGIDSLQRGFPNFDLDMNRIFPGNQKGTMVEQAAYRITEDLKGADMVIDIHSSNLYLRECPQVRINVLHEEWLVPYAKMLDVDFIWVHDAATVLESTLAYSLNSTGTPCLVVELGVGQRINDHMCAQLTDGVFNLLAHMGVWKGQNNALPSKPIICKGDRVDFLNAADSGVFLTEQKTGTVVESGQKLGAIVDPLTGTILSEVISPCQGYLFTIRAYPIVYEGSLMARIYKFDETEISTGGRGL